MRNERALFALSYGLFVLTARAGEKDNGCIINTAMQVTDTPNRIAIAVNQRNLTHDMVHESGHFTLSILSEEADFALFQRFGFQSGRDAHKFHDFQEHTRRGENGILYVTQGTNAWISGRVVSEVNLDTHTLFVADVVDADVISATPSATYAYYHTRIKPQPQVSPANKKRWVCRVCGYVYEGDTLPDDFICPICKHPASDFVLQESETAGK